MKANHFNLDYQNWKQEIPIPVLEEKPEYLELYWKAWELAHDHVKEIPGMPQSPYMDEAFILTDIWIWDTCFMLFFCRYAPHIFPGIQTLNNFYQPLYDGKKLPQVVPHGLPAWCHLEDGKPTQLMIHIPDNPPLFAWAEYNYALMTGDKEHLRDLLLRKQYLQKHFAWMESLFIAGWKTDFTRAPTCLVKRPDGYFWEGGRSGMDNTPRGRLNGKAGKIHRPNHPEMLWVDAISQQALTAACIAKIAALIGEDSLSEQWNSIHQQIAEKVNRLYWDPQDGIYYDIHEQTHEFMKCVTPASFWPLLAEIATPEQEKAMTAYLTNPRKLGGLVPWTTVARDDADFVPEHGQYWRGAVWLPTAYMGIKGLERYGDFNLAHEQACKIVEHMYQTFKNFEPHTIWECYSPNTSTPAHTPEGNSLVRPDFCGWSALGPIALLIENVIGVTGANAFEHSIVWNPPEAFTGKLGMQNYSFGDTVTSFVLEGKTCSVSSNLPYTMIIHGKEYPIPAGNHSFVL